MNAHQEAYRSLINKRLQELLMIRSSPQAELFKAAQYALLGPGKRLRPLLLLSVLEGYGVPINLGLDPACALECIHTYSLIHDDLPCMDDDDMRRGRPTLHKVFPEALAVLTGDFLLTYAFEILSSAPHLSSAQRLSLVRSLAYHAGSEGMIGGQVVDILYENAPMSFEMLHFMHLHKTAALFISSVECGAIIAEVTEEDKNSLMSAAQALGIAFQVIDDLSDHQEDGHSGANTLSILGLEKTEELALKLLQEALRKAQTLSKSCPLLEKMIEDLLNTLSMKSYLST